MTFINRNSITFDIKAFTEQFDDYTSLFSWQGLSSGQRVMWLFINRDKTEVNDVSVNIKALSCGKMCVGEFASFDVVL